MRRPDLSVDDITLSPAELAKHVQSSLDANSRELAWLRTSFVALLFTLLAIVNYLTLPDESKLLATLFALAVAVAFAVVTAINLMVAYRDSLTNLVMFIDLCILQTDFIAFNLVTEGLMSGFGVSVLIIVAGIFMTTYRWLTGTVLVMLVSWSATLWLSESALLARDTIMLVTAVFCAFFMMTLRFRSANKLGRHELLQEKYKESLEYAIDHIETLSGLLPICASCKSIRAEGNQWTSIEAYVAERSDVEFTHSVCPTCHKELYSEFSKTE